MAESSPLKIENLSVTYGDFQAVKSLNLSLKKGEIFGLLGPNGAGKTSTISSIVGLESISQGNIWIQGVSVLEKASTAKSLIGYVPQEIINHGYFNVNEIMKFHSGYFGRSKNQERIDYLLKRLGLWEHRGKKVKQLSGGMKRRLLIAKALVHEPNVVILDEPTAGVDIELRASLWEFVKELRKEGTSILLTTHYLEEAEALCDRIGVIHQGELLKVDQTQSLIKDLTHRKVHIRMASPIEGLESDYLVSQNGVDLIFSLPSSQELGGVLKILEKHLPLIKDIKIAEGNLEEAFLNVLKKQESLVEASKNKINKKAQIQEGAYGV